MGARSLPTEPRFADSLRHEVWRRLVAQLRPDDVVLADVHLVGAHQDHDVDFIVLMPDVGVMVIEVQSGVVSTKGMDWYRDGDRRITPIGHVLGKLFAVRRHLGDDPRWPGARLRMQHCVVAPDSEFPAEFEMPDCTRAQVHAAGDQPHLATRMRETLMHDHQGGRPPRPDEIVLIADILHGPPREDALSSAAMRLTGDQMAVLRTQRHLRRSVVHGATGTGKSTLALAQARELTRGRPDTVRERVALVCYSTGHAARLRRLVASLDDRERPAFVGTFEELGRRWGVAVTDRDDADQWERRFPEQLLERLTRVPMSERFDTVIVDEGQDFTGAWWPAVRRALRDEEQGGFHQYRDVNRHLYREFPVPPVTGVGLLLHDNLRNTTPHCRDVGTVGPRHGGAGPCRPTGAFRRSQPRDRSRHRRRPGGCTARGRSPAG